MTKLIVAWMEWWFEWTFICWHTAYPSNLCRRHDAIKLLFFPLPFCEITVAITTTFMDCKPQASVENFARACDVVVSLWWRKTGACITQTSRQHLHSPWLFLRAHHSDPQDRMKTKQRSSRWTAWTRVTLVSQHGNRFVNVEVSHWHDVMLSSGIWLLDDIDISSVCRQRCPGLF